ncbi:MULTISPECIES: MgtC/SapB family protein [unclassified Pseudomonas]|uniref:MgtC/SapB family protein n=1 Tax=unclassified Pseudomonas TaxID=196821 RepID=UPI000BD1B489|nr:MULTISPECIES: MgtC/SapB family protein [unclassified Pseudomonas]PVZ15758.1 putative Mg2+ transporter-C (MgtC) family protein [Pseudomonas sp. URIL14HWK12:I12]PVZ25132.1 putative Mg2+ transporter-C (MgtC) family protein [Pseudomonas sp. URIL14HWK12:I10]PVZ34978.1 putative Mg2+ transporter-C (MgtC) family protein [Pseudomonas sp. URIL14HWK12:I11]SNZ09819.1 putative Mg2+ transporter-C (MgtC) family protein [Pseudomonas sp. URIL14HWK12:I9]
MPLFHATGLHALAVAALHLGCAFVLGALIGFERQLRQRTAGLRTNTLVAVGAATFVLLGARLFDIYGGGQTPVHVVAYVVSGIGFLGAGTIIKEGANISGLNTAATLWGSGAVGASAGAGLIAEAAIATVFVLASNTLLRPWANWINRMPLRADRREATYTFYVICARQHHGAVREQVSAHLEQASYPARQIDDEPFGQHDVELAFTLYATAVQSEELDTLSRRLQVLDGVRQAFWSAADEA